MNIKVLGCHGGELPNFRTTSFLINKKIILDAGSVTSVLNLNRQLSIEHVLLTHAHADHCRDILFLADNVIGVNGKGFSVYGMPVVLNDIKKYLLNWRIWPDFTKIPDEKNPVVKMKELKNEQTIEIDGLKITACMVNHTVPTSGFIIDNGRSSVVFSSDTAPTDRIWELASQLNNLAAVFIECSFPDEEKKLAVLSKHLTPRMVANEVRKIGKDVDVYAYHIKPQFYKQVVKELKRQKKLHVEPIVLNQIIKV